MERKALCLGSAVLLLAAGLSASSVGFSRKEARDANASGTAPKGVDAKQDRAIVALISDSYLMKTEMSAMKAEMDSMASEIYEMKRRIKALKAGQGGAPSNIYTIKTKAANVRAKPSLYAKVVRYLVEGDIFVSNEHVGHWLKIENGGYIHESIVRKYNGEEEKK